jgi:hypothetical protein
MLPRIEINQAGRARRFLESDLIEFRESRRETTAAEAPMGKGGPDREGAPWARVGMPEGKATPKSMQGRLLLPDSDPTEDPRSGGEMPRARQRLSPYFWWEELPDCLLNKGWFSLRYQVRWSLFRGRVFLRQFGETILSQNWRAQRCQTPCQNIQSWKVQCIVGDRELSIFNPIEASIALDSDLSGDLIRNFSIGVDCRSPSADLSRWSK